MLDVLQRSTIRRTLADSALTAFAWTAAEAADDSEAPLLAERVSAVTVLLVEERLPVEPMVVTPHAEMGSYGGTWRATMFGASDDCWLIKTIA